MIIVKLPKNKIMSLFDIKQAKNILELKRLNSEIEKIEMDKCIFGEITSDQKINLYNYKQQLTFIIKSL